MQVPSLQPSTAFGSKYNITLADAQRQEMIITRPNRNSQTNTLTTANRRMIRIPTSRDEQMFRALVDQWRTETQCITSDTDIAGNFAYQQIIGMGEHALKLIFRELQEHGGRWFWALRAITRENPVNPEDRGDVRRMTESWLEWARQRDYVR
jgi:hypothetical protein